MMVKRGTIVNKDEFVNASSYNKEQFEHLLVAGYPESREEYMIGVELDDGRVMVVDTASERNVRERLQNWAAQVEQIRSDYRCDYNPT